MPRIVSTPQARPSSRPAPRARSKASEAMGKLLARGVTATEDHAPQDRAQQRETLQELTGALADAGFSLSSSKNGASSFAHKDGTRVEVNAGPHALKVAYFAPGAKKPASVDELATAIPFGAAPDKSAAAKVVAGGAKKPDAMDLKKAGFPSDPSTSTLFHPDGSWAVDTDDGFVVGHGDVRVWPKRSDDDVTARSAAASSVETASVETASVETASVETAKAQAADTIDKPTTTTTTTTTTRPKAPASDTFAGVRMPASLVAAPWQDAVAPRAQDATLDAVMFLGDARGERSITALRKKLEGVAAQSNTKASDGWRQESWRFADGSRLVLAVPNGETELRAYLLRPTGNASGNVAANGDEGERINVDLAKSALFTLPITTEKGPAAATLDAKLLRSPDAAAELKQRGFKPAGDRLFVHQDGSWAAIVPRPSASTGEKAPRVACGVGERRYALGERMSALAERDNDVAALPAWLRSMVSLSAPGQDVDLQIFAKQLGALDHGMLAALQAAGYELNVTRYRLSNAMADLKDRTSTGGGAGAFLVDLAEGVHRAGGGDTPSITVRTYLADGVLRVDVSTLLHEIGHAFDLVIPNGGGKSNAIATRGGVPSTRQDPMHVEQDFVDAFTAEHQRLPQYFHTQPEFVAETFALYMLDPVRCKRQFPLAFACFDKRFASIRPDPAQLLALEQAFDRPAIAQVAAGPDVRKQLAFDAQRNRVLKDAGVPTQPVVVHLEGKSDWGVESYVADVARSVRNAFGKDAGVHRSNENLITLTTAQTGSAQDIEKILTDIETSGRPAVLFVKDASTLTKTSALFQVIEQFVQRHRDVPPLILAGDASALQAVDGAVNGAVRLSSKLEALNPAQQAELVSRIAEQEGFFFERGAVPLLETKLKGGGYQAATVAWRSVKTAQFERQLQAAGDAQDVAATLTEVREIAKADVEAMKLPTKKTAAERLADMIGQDEAKRVIDSITKQAKVSALRRKEGLPDPDPPRMNLLFSGPPGTGKTTFAEILGELLQEIGYIKAPTVTKVTIQDLVSASPEAAVKALFAANKGGVIFIDEMHQLKDTAEGKRAFRAMIPYLADPAYADTVFIGAGYSDELGELVRDVDAGAERRFSTVPFLDYKREQLAAILDVKLKSQNLVMGPEAREAALAFLDYRKRITKNFGNAGEIDIALGHAQKAQTLRVADLPADKITKRVLMELVPEDFAVPAPITKAEFWKAMDAMSGWDEIKAQLKEMAAAIEGAVKRGKAPTDAVEPYWIVDGPPGTGKTTLASMLSMFGAAYGLTALPDVHSVQGANFQGEFVGQTAGVVQKQFEKAWGRLMFVDEVSGLAKSGGDFKFEAAKIILAQTENHRGKFMMVVADYAHNINQFLALDPGLARRFGNRITLKPWTAEQATDDLRKKLGSEGIPLLGLDAQLKKAFGLLVKEPGYASGGDVRTLKNAIVSYLDARPNDDVTKALPKAIDAAFAALIDKKKKDAGPAASNPLSSAPLATAVAVATASLDAEKEVEVSFSSEDNRVLAAIDMVNQLLAAQLNGLPSAEIARLETDPRSQFAKELAKQLGVKVEEAVKMLTRVRVKVKKMVTKQELVQRFVYHCPFCGRVDSASCAYINESLEWKMQRSLRKPWVETKTSQHEVEVIEERDVPTGGGARNGDG